jgi:hypothetical protein
MSDAPPSMPKQSQQHWHTQQAPNETPRPLLHWPYQYRGYE